MDETIKIGLVGFGSVGKDTVARYLSDKYGFAHVSSGDLIREYVRKNNLGALNRSNLQIIGNDLRKKYGADYLTMHALEVFKHKVPHSSRVVISGLRALPEVNRLKSEGGVVIAVTAPLERRYSWAVRRGSATDHVTLEEFKSIEDREAENANEVNQNIKAVLAAADMTIVNSGSRDQLFDEVDRIVTHILKP